MFSKSCGLAASVIFVFGAQIAGSSENSYRNPSPRVSLPNPAVGGTISIQYSLLPLGGNAYRYVYSITNNGSLPGSAPVQDFVILFNTSLYGSIQSATATVNPSLLTQWSEDLLLPLPGLPEGYDALALTGGIPAGTTVSGFAVQFNWLGTGVPGSQPFQIYDPTNLPYQLLQTGQTGSPATVPATSPLSLLAIGVGLALAAAYLMRRQYRSA